MLVISLKDIISFSKKILIVILIIGFGCFFISKISTNIVNLNILNRTILFSRYYKKDSNLYKKISMNNILHFELLLMNSNNISSPIEETENSIELEEDESKDNTIVDEEDKSDVLNKLNTQIINKNNKIDTYTDIIDGIKIKNESKYDLMLEIKNTNFELTDKKDIIIYHTHTCESYTPTDENNYVQTGNYRTTDLNHSVAKVGDELTNYLINYSFNVLHDKTYHDFPAYTGSYERGYVTISNLLKKNNSEIIIDLHRDALGNLSSYAPTIQIGDEIVSQVMFVIGTDGGDLEHPNWRNNLKTAIDIQKKAEEMYPGFFKPIIVRNSRYNQHVANAAFIIEVGATGNTLEQCEDSMKYLANILKEFLE